MQQSDAARPLRYGEALPQLFAASNRNPRFALGSLGGRFVLFAVLGKLQTAEAQRALKAVLALGPTDPARVCTPFCADPDATAFGSIGDAVLAFNDTGVAVASGLHDPQDAPEGRWVLLDPSLRVAGVWSLAEAEQALAALAQAPAPDDHAGAPLHAPVLIAPRIFEPELCQHLIAYCEREGVEPSGVTRQHPDGATFLELQNDFKRRFDCIITDTQLREAITARIHWRLAPEIEKAFMWRPTRIERHLIARYDAEGGGYFRPHRDNTTKGTAHRRFAVTINLNAEAYEGGDLRFPEFGARTYRAPTGGAVVFSCSLLHEATPVTRGVRYAFLPFLYDEAAAALRIENDKYLDESLRYAP